jgi:hypothetical protein
VRRNLRIELAPWCHCATALGNPELALPRECQAFSDYGP